jgi:molecular chaperone GrpE
MPEQEIPPSEQLADHTLTAEAAAGECAAPPETATPTPEAVLLARLKDAEMKAAEHHDAWLRARAETENVRRRAQEDLTRAQRYSIEKFAGELLPVRDSLQAALADREPSVEVLKAGVELTLRQLDAAFEKSGLREIDPLGEKFDPHRHQAMGMAESAQEPNTVATVLQKGYLLADRVLRPALVMVAKPRD